MNIGNYNKWRRASRILILSFGLFTAAAGQTPDLNATRIKIVVRDVREISFPETITSVVVVETETVAAEIIGNRILRLTALDFGETMIVAATPAGRKILVIEVVGKPLAQVPAARPGERANRLVGDAQRVLDR